MIGGTVRARKGIAVATPKTRKPPQLRVASLRSLQSNTAIDSTCAVCGNMFTTPAALHR
jgi:hypothetical protein